ncbi:MAG: hypothetical protein AAB851_01935, partial [Patescibacteria group bacterium]
LMTWEPMSAKGDFIFRRRGLSVKIGKPFTFADVDCSAEEWGTQIIVDFILKRRKEEERNLPIGDEEKKLMAISLKIAKKIEELI